MKNKNTVIYISVFITIIALLCLLITFILYINNKKKNSLTADDVIEEVVTTLPENYNETSKEIETDATKEVDASTEPDVNNPRGLKLDMITEYTSVEPIEEDSNFDYAEQSNLIKKLPEFLDYINLFGITSIEDVVLEKYDVFDNFIQYTYNIKNTDSIFIVQVIPNEEWLFLERVNRYNSEYPIITFTNGVPSNSEYIYELLVENEIYRDCTTDYREGEFSIELYDSTTNEPIAVLTL